MKYLWKCLQMACKNNDVSGTHAVSHLSVCKQTFRKPSPDITVFSCICNHVKLKQKDQQCQHESDSNIFSYITILLCNDIEFLYGAHHYIWEIALFKSKEQIFKCTLIVHYTYINLHSMKKERKKCDTYLTFVSEHCQ